MLRYANIILFLGKITLMNKLLTSIIFLSFSLSLFSQVGGKHTYKFLTTPNSSRIAAMGGNNVSHYDDDLNFAHQNPGLLRSEMTDRIMLNYINYFSDINLGQVSYAKNLSDIGIFSAGIQYSNYGKFLHTDEIGTIFGDFVPAEYAISVSHARPIINEKFNIGASLKLIYSDFWTYSSYGVAIDAGISYIDTAKLFSAGLAIKNLGSQLKPYTKGNYEPLPIDLQIGITKKFAHAPIRFSLTAQDLFNWKLASYESIFKNENIVMGEEKPRKSFFNKLGDAGDEFIRHFILGVELVPHKNFYISLGYNYRRRAELALPTRTKLVGMSIGFGLKLSKFNISYGLASYHLAGASNHFSVGLNLNSFYKKI